MSLLGALVLHHPRGVVDLDEGGVARRDLEVAAELLDEVWLLRDALLDEQSVLSLSSLLETWEAEFDLRRTTSKATEARVAAVAAALRALPDLRPATLETILGTLAEVTITVEEPYAFRCDDADSVCDDPGDVLDGACLFFVNVDEAGARAGDISRDELDYYTTLHKPAHTQGYTRCDDFACDDDWSLTDRDLLGG